MDKSSSNPLVQKNQCFILLWQVAGLQCAQCSFLHARNPIQMLIFTIVPQYMTHLQSQPDLGTRVRPEFT